MLRFFKLVILHFNGSELIAGVALAFLGSMLVTDGKDLAGLSVAVASVLAFSLSVKGGRGNG